MVMPYLVLRWLTTSSAFTPSGARTAVMESEGLSAANNLRQWLHACDQKAVVKHYSMMP